VGGGAIVAVFPDAWTEYLEEQEEWWEAEEWSLAEEKLALLRVLCSSNAADH